jgi:hypothetical protein
MATITALFPDASNSPFARLTPMPRRAPVRSRSASAPRARPSFAVRRREPPIVARLAVGGFRGKRRRRDRGVHRQADRRRRRKAKRERCGRALFRGARPPGAFRTPAPFPSDGCGEPGRRQAGAAAKRSGSGSRGGRSPVCANGGRERTGARDRGPPERGRAAGGRARQGKAVGRGGLSRGQRALQTSRENDSRKAVYISSLTLSIMRSACVDRNSCCRPSTASIPPEATNEALLGVMLSSNHSRATASRDRINSPLFTARQNLRSSMRF